MFARPIPGYEGGNAVGQRKVYVVSGNGPGAGEYVQATGDVLTLGPGIYIDDIVSGNERYSVTAAHFMRVVPSAVGTTRATWSIHYFVTAGGLELGAGVDISTEEFQFTVLGGEF